MAESLTSRMAGLRLEKPPDWVFVDTETALAAALHEMRHETTFAFDCEGVDLGRRASRLTEMTQHSGTDTRWVACLSAHAEITLDKRDKLTALLTMSCQPIIVKMEF